MRALVQTPQSSLPKLRTQAWVPFTPVGGTLFPDLVRVYTGDEVRVLQINQAVTLHEKNGDEWFIRDGVRYEYDLVSDEWYLVLSATEWFATEPEGKDALLQQVIRLYYAYMAQDVRSPMPHLAGPPGVGKSEVIAQLAKMLGVRLHTVNVSRISPLEIEGVQMPVASTGGVDHDLKLKLLHNTLWTSLKEGDIVLLDEFLRGFPEVYNGLLDIMTSREVAGYKLPRVFFIAASNSVAAYDEALRDRLLHLPVPDIRKSSAAMSASKKALINGIGLLPEVARSSELTDLMNDEVSPMYEMLDSFSGAPLAAGSRPSTGKGHSVRNLVGQARLREVQVPLLRDLIEYNNKLALQQGKAQFVVLLSGKNQDPRYASLAKRLPREKLTEAQAQTLDLNLQLIEMEDALKETTTLETEELPDEDLDFS